MGHAAGTSAGTACQGRRKGLRAASTPCAGCATPPTTSSSISSMGAAGRCGCSRPRPECMGAGRVSATSRHEDEDVTMQLKKCRCGKGALLKPANNARSTLALAAYHGMVDAITLALAGGVDPCREQQGCLGLAAAARHASCSEPRAQTCVQRRGPAAGCKLPPLLTRSVAEEAFGHVDVHDPWRLVRDGSHDFITAPQS